MKVISQYEINKNNAGPKAKIDVENILKKEFNSNISSLIINMNLKNKFNLILFRIKKIIFNIFNYFNRDILVIQFPFSKSGKVFFKSKKKIGFIHDISGLRKQNKELLRKEIDCYNKCDVIISHNEKMTEFLISNGVKNKIIDLEIFDYLCNLKYKNNKFDKNNLKVIYTGNIDKTSFINELEYDKMKFSINVYGSEKKSSNSKINICGIYNPNKLPNIIKGDIGLVWDGKINDSDENIGYKNYTKYNSPHKLSCYLACGLPVIVWSKSAVSSFVKKNNIGYIINDIYDINNIDFKDYYIKKKNAEKIGNKVRKGYYTKEAIRKAVNEL